MNIITTSIATFALLVTCLSSGARAEDSKAEKSATACAELSTETVYENLGYTHFVHLSNTCKKALACTVTASSNPDPMPVELAPEEKHSVVCMRGSPAREFTATVKCKRR